MGSSSTSADLNKELVETVQSGSTEKIKELLERGADSNAKDDDGWTPLHHAAYRGHTHIVELKIAKNHIMQSVQNALFITFFFVPW